MLGPQKVKYMNTPNGRSVILANGIFATQSGILEEIFAKTFNCDAPRGEARQRGGSLAAVPSPAAWGASTAAATAAQIENCCKILAEIWHFE